MKILLIIALITSFSLVAGFYEWSYQQRIRVGGAGGTYGITPPALFGRGFLTLVTGYNSTKPAVVVHTTDDGYVSNSQYVWSQQAILYASTDVGPQDGFGSWMVSSDNTLIIGAPGQGSNRGYAYIFNGTLRHWSQIQRLAAFEGVSGDFFSERMNLFENTLVIAARGSSTPYVSVADKTSGIIKGAAYVFVRSPGGLYWSRHSKLLPDYLQEAKTLEIDNFARDVKIYDDCIIASANSGTLPQFESGSAYIFRTSNAQWSQQQKLVAIDIENYNNKIYLDTIDTTLGPRHFARSIAVNKDYDIAVGVDTLENNKTNRDTVYIFKGAQQAGKYRWSLQQRLFNANDSSPEIVYGADLYTDRKNTLIATLPGPNVTKSYIFKLFGNLSLATTGWSLQQTLYAYNETVDGLYYDGDMTQPRASLTNFSNPIIWGSSMLYSTKDEVQIRTQYKNDSCLLIWMSDHFLDGWDTAVLTVIAPDTTTDKFHPHCDQVDPFLVRYCPYEINNEGVYILKVFAAVEARFFWEVSWQVQVESTGEWYRGDFATKMKFNFNATTMSFSYVDIENEINLDAPCYLCTTIALQSWKQLQNVASSAFWPLVVYGAPWYISDYQGRTLYSHGKVCYGIGKFECYQTMPEGIYILRLGGGLFGNLLGFPYFNASWDGCGVQGGYRDQLVFRIVSGRCEAIQIYRYHGRCDRPPTIDYNGLLGLLPPTSGGTVAPTQSTFGDPYVKGEMYAKRRNGNHRSGTIEVDEKQPEIIVEQDVRFADHMVFLP